MDLPSPQLRLATFAVGLAAALTSCQKSKSTAAAERPIDACTLILQEEVQSIQGAPIKEVKNNTSTNGGFKTSDCLYTSTIDNHSVSLALVQRNSGSSDARDPKQYWETSFSRYAKQKQARDDDEKKEPASEREEAENTLVPAPKKIDGLGDGAFWATNIEGGGALFVLKGNAFIRISIAGSESEEVKIDQSKALAAKALARL